MEKNAYEENWGRNEDGSLQLDKIGMYHPSAPFRWYLKMLYDLANGDDVTDLGAEPTGSLYGCYERNPIRRRVDFGYRDLEPEVVLVGGEFADTFDPPGDGD